MVPIHQLLVEVLRREVTVALQIKRLHLRKLTRLRTARRYFAEALSLAPDSTVARQGLAKLQ